MNTVIIRKLFFAWNMDKEKQFLEDQAKKGLKLFKVSLGKYTFIEADPEDVVYQFDFQMLGKADLEEYLSMCEDWELVQQFGGWLYLRKPSDGKENRIYSNVQSVKSMYHRLMGFLLLVGFPLYYQTFIMFPILREEGIGTFYKYFMPFAYVLTFLHLFALIRIFISYRKLNDIVE